MSTSSDGTSSLVGWSAALPSIAPTGSPRVGASPRRPSAVEAQSVSPPTKPRRLQMSNVPPPKPATIALTASSQPERSVPSLPTVNLDNLKRDASDPQLFKTSPVTTMVVSPRGMHALLQYSPHSQTLEGGGRLPLCYECHMLIDPGMASLSVGKRCGLCLVICHD